MLEKWRRVGIGVFVLFLLAGRARADLILQEGFETVVPAGWTATNNSTKGGSTSWFQGNTGVFTAFSGPDDSYAAANFNNAADGGDISNWLISPVVKLSGASVLSFRTRSTDLPGEAFHDSLEVRVSKKDSTDVGSSFDSLGDFTTVLLAINPDFLGGVYANGWTLYSLSFADVGFGDTVEGRFAFRYVIDDTELHGDYIGIDSVSLESVPEPGSLFLTGAGLVALAAFSRRRRQA